MQIDTKHFGNIEVDEAGVLSFSLGIPGFENYKKYALIGPSDDNSPFQWLQCLDNTDLAFAVANPFLIKKDYEIDIPDNAVEELELSSPDDVIILTVVVVPEDVNKISMNLKAPIIINSKNQRAKQIVLDTDTYTVRHYIIEELTRT
jgi:flagellar assembly factor FliW